MANAITLVEKYQPLLDEVFAEASLTKDLESNEVKFENTETVKIMKLVVPALGDYSRNSGFTSGDVTVTWETWKLSQDRAKSFSIDNMDNDATLDMTFGKASSEFVRTKVVPEVDMYRFAKIAQTAGITKVDEDLASGKDYEEAIATAQASLDNAEAPREGRILYITPNGYQALKSEFATRFNNKADQLNRSFTEFDGMKVVVVPQSRFVDKITKNEGTKIYEKAVDGKNINFLLIAERTVEAVAKHIKMRVFTPDVNQEKDAYKFQYRIVHDCFVYENKVAGVYLHTVSKG